MRTGVATHRKRPDAGAVSYVNLQFDLGMTPRSRLKNKVYRQLTTIVKIASKLTRTSAMRVGSNLVSSDGFSKFRASQAPECL